MYRAVPLPIRRIRLRIRRHRAIPRPTRGRLAAHTMHRRLVLHTPRILAAIVITNQC